MFMVYLSFGIALSYFQDVRSMLFMNGWITKLGKSERFVNKEDGSS